MNNMEKEIIEVSLDDIRGMVNKIHLHTIHLYGGDTK